MAKKEGKVPRGTCEEALQVTSQAAQMETNNSIQLRSTICDEIVYCSKHPLRNNDISTTATLPG